MHTYTYIHTYIYTYIHSLGLTPTSFCLPQDRGQRRQHQYRCRGLIYEYIYLIYACIHIYIYIHIYIVSMHAPRTSSCLETRVNPN